MLRIIKKCFVVILFIIIISLLYSNAFAVSDSDITSNFQGSKPTGEVKTTSQNILKSIISVTRIVAAAVAIVILMIIACKYILASAGDRADIKKYAVNYVIGAIILFGASGILSIIQTFVGEAL